MKLNQNKGIMLIATLLASSVLLILSGAYVATTIVQSHSVESQRDSQQQLYAAEKGIDYAYIEVMNNPNFATHEAEANGNLKRVNSSELPSVILASAGAKIDTESSPSSESYGCYLVPYDSGNQNYVQVKVYIDGPDTIILSRYLTGSTSSLVLKFRVSYWSLYKYFLFNAACSKYDADNKCLEWKPWDAGWATYNGKQIEDNTGAQINVGGIHVNGDIMLRGPRFNKLSELSCSGQIYYAKDAQFNEPREFDVKSWNASEGRYDYNASYIDGKAVIPRYETPPYDFQYPIDSDTNRLNALGFKQGGLYKYLFHHPSVHIAGYDIMDDWPDGPTKYGQASIQGVSIPKILPRCYNNTACAWLWDKYYGLPNDNKVTYPWASESTYTGTEKPVHFEVTDEALKWLIEKEKGAGEYDSGSSPWSSRTWLSTYTTGDTAKLSDTKWDEKEYDWVTLLSIEKEDPASNGAGLNLPYDRGLYNHSEYEVYDAVKYYINHGNTLPSWLIDGGDDDAIGTWIINTLPNLEPTSTNLIDDFFAWWKARSYHHKASIDNGLMQLSGTTYHFSTDTSSVPAWERLFWEAWINYWPGARGKKHNDIYNIAYYNHAVNDEWWVDLIYGGNDSGTNERLSGGAQDAELSLQYVNTSNATQSEEFHSWLADESHEDFSEVVKYSGQGGREIEPMDIKAQYETKAKENGLYIKEVKVSDDPAKDTLRFEMSWNGIAATGNTFTDCLTALKNNLTASGVTRAQDIYNSLYLKVFYNPYEITTSIYRQHSDGSSILYRGVAYNPDDLTDPYNPDKYPSKQYDSGFITHIHDKVYNPTKANAGKPPYIAVIAIEVRKLWFLDKYYNIKLNNGVIYIDCPSYDVLLFGNYVLPRGGFTLVTPYDVYIQASIAVESSVKSQLQKDVDFPDNLEYKYDSSAGYYRLSYNNTKNENNSIASLFNYEFNDLASLGQTNPSDSRQPCAIITNSRVYFFSWDFISFIAPSYRFLSIYPFPYLFPNYPYSLRSTPDTKTWQEHTFLMFCWSNWPTTYVDSEGQTQPFPTKSQLGINSSSFYNNSFTWKWIKENLNNSQQQEALLKAGESDYERYVNTNFYYVMTEKYVVKTASINNYFNVAVSSPEEPRGYRRQRWQWQVYDNSQKKYAGDNINSSIIAEGAFLKIKRWHTYSRWHSPADTLVNEYWTNKGANGVIAISSDTWKNDDNIITACDPGSNATYEYEERLWTRQGRPSADFLETGSEKRIQHLRGGDSFNKSGSQ